MERKNQEQNKMNLQAPVPGLRTVKNLLLTAMAPLGTTLYIYGGGWNKEDKGASKEARTIGISPKWKEFFDRQNADYRYRDDSDREHSYYPYDGINRYSHLGLDCSGYMGWLLYNVLNTESGKEGYVVEASKGARTFAERYGLGTLNPKTLQIGDIISIPGHIWMYIGSCADGSIVFIHSSVVKSRTGADGGGVQFSVLNPKFQNDKTRSNASMMSHDMEVSLRENEKDCDAYRLVESYMKKHFPEWSKRYDVAVKPYDVYLNADAVEVFRWNPEILTDPDGYREMRVEEILLSD